MTDSGLQFNSSIYYRLGGIQSERTYGVSLGGYYRFVFNHFTLSFGVDLDFDFNELLIQERSYDQNESPDGSILVKLGRVF